MTAKDFAARHPKPWHFVIMEVSLVLCDANQGRIAILDIRSNHSGVSQNEWKRHMASAMSEFFPVIESKEATHRRRAIVEAQINELRQPGGPLRGEEPPQAERIDSASPSPGSTAGAQSPRGSGKE